MTTHASPLSVLVGSAGFIRDYERRLRRQLSLGQLQAIERKLLLLGTRYVQNPSAALAHYKKVTYLSGIQTGLKEIDLTSTDRAVILEQDGKVVVLRAGDHSLIADQHYTRSMLLADLADDRASLVPLFGRSVVLAAQGVEAGILAEAIDDPQWIYRLSDEQTDCLDLVLGAYLYGDPPPRVFFIVGGPGTGKTSILLQIARQLEFDPSRVCLSMSDELARHIEAAVGSDFARCRCESPSSDFLERGVWLVDDPRTWNAIVASADLTRPARGGVAVVAVDLGQLYENLTDEQISGWLRAAQPYRVHLTVCYRQKSNLGKQALHYMRLVTERATKFIVKDGREKKWLHEHHAQYGAMNELTFEHGGGTCSEHTAQSLTDLRVVLETLADAMLRGRLWRQTEPLLIIRGEQGWTRGRHAHTWRSEPNPMLSSIVRSVFQAIPRREADLGEIESLRGLEFQHVLVLLPLYYLERLRVGLEGLSTPELQHVRSLRIPFSRGTDRLAVVGIGSAVFTGPEMDIRSPVVNRPQRRK
jgi:hypothetical protein